MNTTTSTIKPSLVEHVFRSVWASNTSSASNLNGSSDALDSAQDDDSDGEAEFLASAESVDVHAAAARVTKISQDALKLSSEYLRLLVLEAFHRAQMEAMVDDSPTIEPHHVEQILAQLLLDF